MKVTKSYIKQLVKEELNRVLNEKSGAIESSPELEKFSMRIREAASQAFEVSGLKAGRLKAIKDGARSALVIDFGGSVPQEVLVYFDGNQYSLAGSASTPDSGINQKIDGISSKLKGAVEASNREINR
jgi:hypothetical protein